MEDEDLAAGFATQLSSDGSIILALTNPGMEDDVNGDPAVSIVLRRRGALALVKDIVDLLCQSEDIPDIPA